MSRAVRPLAVALLPFSVVVALAACGCGGSSPPPPPSGAADNQPAASASSAPRPVAQGTASGFDDEPAVEDESSDVEDGDRFVLASAAGEKWELGPIVRESERMVADPVPPGSDSSTFALVGSTGGNAAAASTQKLPDGFKPAPGTGLSPDGWPLRIRGDKDDAEMAFVPGGVFPQGVPGSKSGVAPARTVMVDGFYMDVHEVTVEQFEAFMTAVRDEKKFRISPPFNINSEKKQPATGVSWGEARNYARWAGKSLPSEAQWEKAARGPSGFPHPWGSGRALWVRPRTPGQIDLVGSFRSDVSPFGIYDLAGNVREWCEDWWAEDAYSREREGGEQTVRNPTGPKSASIEHHRALRGGAADWSMWQRGHLGMSERKPDVGFRCVLNVKPKPPEPAEGAALSAAPPAESAAPARKSTKNTKKKDAPAGKDKKDDAPKL